MMSLLDCYLPAFNFINTFTLYPQEHSNYKMFREECVAILQKCVLASERHHSPQEYEDAFFAVVIWFDEAVLCSSAEWVNKWRAELLQMQYFRTSVGGEDFFNRLDAIDKQDTKLRIVYLFCILMGFHGKYTQAEVKALKLRISQERECLPEAWREWPNNAPLIEPDVHQIIGGGQGEKKLRQKKWLLLLLPVVVYILMFSALALISR